MIEEEIIETEEAPPTVQPPRLTVKDFAAKVKAKYPQYKDIDDKELTDKIILKHPEYKETIDFGTEKKNKVLSNVSAKPLESGLSGTPKVEKSNEPIPYDEKIFTGGVAIEKPKAPELSAFKDSNEWRTKMIDHVERESIATGKIPSVKDYFPQPISDNTRVAPRERRNTLEQFSNQNKQKAEGNKKLYDEAIENTAKKVIEQRVKHIEKKKEGEEVNPFDFISMNMEKKRLRDALDKGELSFGMGKDGQAGLRPTIGFWENFSKKLNEAKEANVWAEKFKDATPDEKVWMLKEQQQAQNEHPEFLEAKETPLASVGGVVAEQLPFIGKAVGGALLGGGLMKLPTMGAFLATSKDAVNHGATDEIIRRFDYLKQNNPNADEVELMKQAENGYWMGAASGLATNAILTGTSLKVPLSLSGKNVLSKAISKTIGTGVHMGATTSLVEGAKLGEGNLEGIEATGEDIAKSMAKTFVEQGTLGSALHIVMSGVPKVLKSAAKFALKDAKPEDIAAVLKMNEDAGTIPPGTAEKVQAELANYKKASEKTIEGLPPEVEASVTGLIEAKMNLEAEAKTKDSSLKEHYDSKIEAIDNQIKKIIQTGKPYAYELNQVGEKYTAPEGITVQPPMTVPEPITVSGEFKVPKGIEVQEPMKVSEPITIGEKGTPKEEVITETEPIPEAKEPSGVQYETQELNKDEQIEATRKLLTVGNKLKVDGKEYTVTDYNGTAIRLLDENGNPPSSISLIPNSVLKSDKIYDDFSYLLFQNGLGEKKVAIKPTQKQEPSGVQNGVKEIVETNTELSKIGTSEEYNEYLKTIFPESQVKDIVFHRSNESFDEFDNSKLNKLTGGFFDFSKISSNTHYGKNLYPVLLNIKKIGQGFELKNGEDGSHSTVMGGEKIYSVPDSKQVHILGSKKDIEGFKKWKENKQLSEPKPQAEPSGVSGEVGDKTKQQLLDERNKKIKEIKDKAEGTREERTKRYNELVNELGDETAALKKLQSEINDRAKAEIDKLPALPKTENDVINEKGESDFEKIKKDLDFKENDNKWGEGTPMDEDMGDMLLSKDKESVIFIKPNEVEVYDEINDSTDTIVNGVKIELVSTKKSSRGQGKAKEMVQKVTDWADENNTNLYLDIAPQDKSTTESGLKKLYESFGFEFDGIHGVRKPKSEKKPIQNEEAKLTEPTIKEAEGGETKEVVSEPVEEAGGAGEEKGITHAANEERRGEVNLPEYEREQQSFEQWSKEADELLAKGYDMEKLLKKMENREATTPVENAIRKKYIATLDSQLSKNPTPELLAAKTRYTRIQDLSNTEAGRQLVSLKGTEGKEDNLANFLMDEANAAGVETLPQEKINEYKKKYEADQEVINQLNAKIAKLEEDKANSAAATELVKEAKKTKKVSKDFKAARQSLKDKLKQQFEEYKAAGQKLGVSADGGVESFAISVDMAKTIGEYVKTYLEEGAVKLADVVSKVYEEIKDLHPSLTERDVRDVIAGKYAEKKKTRSETAISMRNLKLQQTLLDKIEKLENGEKLEKKPIVRQRIGEEVQKLKDRFKELGGEEISDESKLKSYKTGLKNKIEKLKKDLETGDFMKEPEPKKPLQLDAEALKLKDQHIRFVKETNLRRAKEEFARRGKGEKTYDYAMQALGIKRIVQTAIDLSMPFRQGVTLAMNPRRWDTFYKANKSMMQSVLNPKKFDRIMYDIHKSADYQNMLKDKVHFNEMDAVDSNSRNEDFQKSFLYKIPIIREPLLASNRAADGFLNVARYDMYMKGKNMLTKQGMTRENSPEAYEALGKWVMNMTGRGNLAKFIEDSHNGRILASNTFFGARLMASRFNLLNPMYYKNMPKEVRVEALKDMGSYVGMVMVTALAAKAAGMQVETDPDDPDFLKLQTGDTRYDITGGMVQYVRTFLRMQNALIARMNPKVSKEVADEKAKKALGSVGNFFKYKLAPNTSYGLSAISGKDPLGNDFDPTDALKIYPMYVDDMITAYKQNGISSLATVGIPSIVGVGVQTYKEKPRKAAKEPKKQKQPKKPKEYKGN